MVALATLLVSLPTAALGGSSRHVSNTTTFLDSIGEDPQAPDIVNIVVSNDDAGNITFQINISNRPALTPDMLMLIFLDTDSNAQTGDVASLGSEYAIQLESGAVGLFQWNGSDYLGASSQTSLTYAYTTGGATIHISGADLGKTKAFKFGTIFLSGIATGPTGEADFTNVHVDAAPDRGHGFYTYEVKTQLILSVTAFTTSPKPAKAGRAFSASLAATQNDTGGPVASGTASCNATIAFKKIVAVTHVVTNGVASCVWKIPATAKGKTLRGTITLTVQGVKVTRTFSSKIS